MGLLTVMHLFFKRGKRMKKAWLTLLTVITLVAVSIAAAPVKATLSMYAGKSEYVGDVSVSCDGTYLYITISTIGDWVLTETHLAVATSLEGIPQTKSGNPKVGRFPYKHEDLGGVPSDPYTIALSEIGASSGDLLYIAAHAVVWNPCLRQEETGWVVNDCTPEYFSGNSWATYFTYLCP